MDRVQDTWQVVRAVGARGIAGAAWRRAAAHGRDLGRALRRRFAGDAPAHAPWFIGALRAAPSPLLLDDSAGFAAEIVGRAEHHGAVIGRETEDPRLDWEPRRLARVVWLAAGTRLDERLRGAFEHAARDALGDLVLDDPLEVALRAWNLWLAASLAGPARLAEPLAATMAAALVEHARWLQPNLDDRGLVVGSHLLGELTGLYACGVALQAAGEEPASWRRLARARLLREAQRQVLGDGGGAEGSTGYARFVAELWLCAAAAARAARDLGLARVAEQAAQTMLAALTLHIAPDGRDVGIGDDDDSRVVPPQARDPRDLTGLAACRRGRRLEGLAWSEEASWLYGAHGRAAWEALPEAAWPTAHHAAAFGLALGRTGGLGGDMVALRAGPHGQSGAGGHAHNDPLAVAVWLDGAPVVIDPGTGVYLGRRALRDRFRGVAAHATVCVDGQEPSPIPVTRPFALPDAAGARVVATADGADAWSCVAEHDGYRRLGVRHRREVFLDRRARRVRIVDHLDGDGAHDVALSFPLADPAMAAWVRGDGGDRLNRRIDAGLRSPHYGTVAPAAVLRRVGRVRLPFTCTTTIAKSGEG